MKKYCFDLDDIVNKIRQQLEEEGEIYEKKKREKKKKEKSEDKETKKKKEKSEDKETKKKKEKSEDTYTREMYEILSSHVDDLYDELKQGFSIDKSGKFKIIDTMKNLKTYNELLQVELHVFSPEGVKKQNPENIFQIDGTIFAYGKLIPTHRLPTTFLSYNDAIKLTFSDLKKLVKKLYKNKIPTKTK